jgi:methylated-DNA-[protein]-cysteine S-methyltransferase
MNEGARDLNDDRVAALLREAAGRMSPRGDPARVVERTLASSTDRLFVVDSHLGELYVGAGSGGVRLVRRRGSAEGFTRDYRRRFGRLLAWSNDSRTRELAEEVARAVAGEEKARVPLDLSETTPFGRRVLEVVGGIPRGEVRPYLWVAREAGSPGAARAVGTAMANNPVPLLVPCHRVIRNDGTTGDYAFGAEQKVRLLEMEGVPTQELAGTPYLATPTTGIFCHATCPNARRIRPKNRRRFRTAAEAVEAGYRPCEVCRPVVVRWRREAAG